MSAFAWRPWRRRGPAPSAKGQRRRQASAFCLGGVLLLAAVVVGLYVRDDGKLSPVDETQHVDYLDKAGHLEFPVLGGVDGAVARHELACRGVEADFKPASCADAATAPNSEFPENALNTAAADPPLYYLVTGLAARAGKAILHLGSLVTAGRLLGFVWLAAALVVLWLVMEELDIGLVARTSVAALLATTPAIVLSSATVTSDATLMLAGAAMLYAALRWERGALPAWVALVIAALCGLAKLPALVAVAAVSAYLLARWLRTPHGGTNAPRRPGELVKMAIAVPAAGLVMAAAWALIVHIRTLPGVPTSASIVVLHTDHLSFGQVVAQVTATATPVQTPDILAPFNDPEILAVVGVFNVLLLAATFGGVLFTARGSRLEALAISTSLMMLVAGPLFLILFYVYAHAAFNIPPRYGLAIVPCAAALLASALCKTWVRCTIAGIACVAAAFTVFHLAAFHPV